MKGNGTNASILTKAACGVQVSRPGSNKLDKVAVNRVRNGGKGQILCAEERQGNQKMGQEDIESCSGGR